MIISFPPQQRRPLRKIAIVGTAILAAIAITTATSGGSASAATRTLVKYKAEIAGASNAQQGHATVSKYKFTRSGTPSYVGWAAQTYMHLPVGDYNFAVSVGTAVDANGQPHHFDYYRVCSFHSNGTSTVSGCGAGPAFPANVDLSHSSAVIDNGITQVAIGALVKQS